MPFDVDRCSRETSQRPYVAAGDRKRRAVCVVEVSADHHTAFGRCSRMDGLIAQLWRMCTWSYIPAGQLLFMGKCSLETSLIPESKSPNGSRFRPPVSDVNLLPISLTHEALLRLNPGAVFC
jgi:hypothetical protein